MQAEFRVLSSLEKLFLDEEPCSPPPIMEGFCNEAISWQVAIRLKEGWGAPAINVEVISEAAKYVQVRQVRHVPVQLAAYPENDGNYLRTSPGLYPDLLQDVGLNTLHIRPHAWECLWLTLDAQGKLPAGNYPVTLRLTDAEGALIGEHTQSVTLLNALLPAQRLKHTKWLHVDCLADYYRVAPWSEAHWRITENFVRSAVAGGVNMILTPIHTPPLDTRVGGERTTVQLVGITRENGKFFFDMTRVHRWIAMCRSAGVEHYEMAHLFTQWGAVHAPKIMATVNGVEQRLFGWETDALGPEYAEFLQAYIPALRQVFREEGVENNVYWHISDEPTGEQLVSYQAAKRQVESLLEGAHIMDALSDFSFYQQGVVAHPVVAIDHIAPFLEAKVPGLWTYYCCAQCWQVPNLFISMPSARCRILGMLLFHCRCDGFLQWGYNFYNSELSDGFLNPYHTTDADGWVPAGDPFQVYPGPDGQPEPSIRWMVFREALQDLRALNLLAEHVGWEQANALLGDMTITKYPQDAQALLQLRRKINAAILENQ